MPGVPPAEAPAAADLRPWTGLAVFYTATFAVLAVYMQFFPVWLHEVRGLDKEQVTVVLSAQTIARTLAGPFWAQRVDRTGRPRTMLLGLAWAGFAAFLLFGFGTGTAWLWLCAFLFGCFYSPMHPILDAHALQCASRHGFAYGRVRMVGSIAFLVVILAVGQLLEVVPATLVFTLIAGGLVLTGSAAVGLPRGEAVAAPPGERAPLGELLRSGPFVLLLAASALIQGSHATYYNLSTLHWSDHGIGKGTASFLWAEGIIAEIVLFYVARGRFDRLRPTTLLLIGGLGAVVRWLVIGATVSVPLLFAANWLHALSFACTYLGSMRALERRVARHQRATAQGLLGAATSGIGMVVAALLGGFVYERWGDRAFFVMAAFAAVGTGLAILLRRQADTAQKQLANVASASAE